MNHTAVVSVQSSREFYKAFGRDFILIRPRVLKRLARRHVPLYRLPKVGAHAAIAIMAGCCQKSTLDTSCTDGEYVQPEAK